MKPFFFSAMVGLISLSTSARTDNNKIVPGQIDGVYSNILGEQIKVWVYVPNSLSAGSDTSTEYPVVYLLYGDGHFESVAGMIQ